MFYKHHLSTKHSLDTLETEISVLDPDLYRNTIHAIIGQIRCKYNGPELKELLVNINRLEEYNMYKLARCNKELERQASFAFKLSEIEALLEKFNVSFLKVLEDSPDYRLDDLYRRFVHINHKLSELDPEHMKIFGGNISDNTGLPGRKVARQSQKLMEKVEKKSNQNIRLMRLVEEGREQNEELRREIENAKIETREVIEEIMRFKDVQKGYDEKISHLQNMIGGLKRRIDEKDQMLRQKDQLVENYKSSIQKLKYSLLTPTKLTRSPKQPDQSEKVVLTAQTALKKLQHNYTARQPVIFEREDEDAGRMSPGFRSQKGSFTPKSSRTPPRPPSVGKLLKPKSKETKSKIDDSNDFWNMLLVQCASLEEMINAEQ